MPWLRLSPEPCPAQAAVLPARGPLCSLFRATLPESCACPRPDFRLSESLTAALQRGLGEVGSRAFAPHPDLGVREQAADLVEQQAGRRTVRLERLDPLEPRQHGAGLVHASTVAGKDAPLRGASVSFQLATDCTAK